MGTILNMFAVSYLMGRRAASLNGKTVQRQTRRHG